MAKTRSGIPHLSDVDRWPATLKVGLHENNYKWSGAEASGAKLKQVERS